ncbi:MAG: Gfo/Idh/MocA family oxidoreductase [Anaerolineae bacterium]|nr:Gfo/Idh/MocA family oxidoreductase [Anaerolineae bacterium]
MRPIGIALIGYGGIGRVHALAYRSLLFHYGLPADAIRIVGVATGHAETAERAAREIGCEVWTDDYRTLLARDDVHVVDICTPNHAHEVAVLAAVGAGKHVYVEKPLALDVAQARRMVQAVSGTQLKGQVTFNFRFTPAVVRARQLMTAGFTGRIFSFHTRYNRSSYIAPEKPLSWRLSREAAGGGALFDLGSHALDLVHFLLGEVSEVNATLETLIPERPTAPGSPVKALVDVDDLDLLQLRMRDGTLGVVEVSRMGTGATNDLQIEIFGELGALRLSSNEPDWLYLYDTRASDRPLGGMRGFTRVETGQRFDGQVMPDWTMPMNFIRSHAESQYQFLKSIWEDRPPQPDLADGLYVQRLMAAAERSSADRRWVKLNEV